MKNLFKLFSIIILIITSNSNSFAAEKVEYLKTDWSFKGLFGKFDRASLQRGYQVYTEVCASCHSMKYLSYRNLAEPGGPEFSEAQAKAIAASFEVTDGPNSDGEMFTRPGKLSESLACLVNISPSLFGPSVNSNWEAMILACSLENSGPPGSWRFL